MFHSSQKDASSVTLMSIEANQAEVLRAREENMCPTCGSITSASDILKRARNAEKILQNCRKNRAGNR